MISYKQALGLTVQRIAPLQAEMMGLIDACRRVAAEDLVSKVDSPSVDASLKDGYAVRSVDLEGASPERPATLERVGLAAAGGGWTGRVERGKAVRILTGAPVPDGAM